MKILMVGAGGYASLYVNEFIKNENLRKDLCGIVDPYIESAHLYPEIRRLNIPVFASIEDYYALNKADLTVISTPPFLHCYQTQYAIKNGSNVLCEKPAAPTVGEVEEIIDCSKKYGKFAAIGFQWSFSDAIQSLKKDILDGVFGNPIELKTFISWPRNKAYYGRTTGWGGKTFFNGKPLYDSVLSNACAHYMHNMLFVLGNEMRTSAQITDVDCALFRANDIESFDTCTVKAYTDKGVPTLFVASHAAEINRNPEFVYRFENGTVKYSQNDSRDIVATLNDGETKNYGNPFEKEVKKLYDCIDSTLKDTVPICSAFTALPHVRLTNMIAKRFEINDFPKDRIRLDEKDNRIYVKGLYDDLRKAYDTFDLLRIE
ncbi:MAG: Gfo/Idh/MocA family oxidoreductase [Clostridia bacterium]|nr:Gfo/Idh/MocA family oxidoreductase [Clostridia bacterium]